MKGRADPSPGCHRIETERLIVRAYRPEEAEILCETIAGSLAHLRAWLPWAMQEPEPPAHKLRRIEAGLEAFRAGTDHTYGVFLRDSGRHIGACGCHPRVGPRAREIGYWIGAPFVGRGYAGEAAAGVTGVGFHVLGLDAIEIRCDPANTASARIPERLGYQHVATARDDTRTPDGRPRDTMIWRLERDAFPDSPAARMPVQITLDPDLLR